MMKIGTRVRYNGAAHQRNMRIIGFVGKIIDIPWPGQATVLFDEDQPVNPNPYKTYWDNLEPETPPEIKLPRKFTYTTLFTKDTPK